MALAEIVLWICTQIKEIVSVQRCSEVTTYIPYIYTQWKGCFITCTHTGCARRRAAQWARVSWRRFSSAAHRSENTNHVNLQTSSHFLKIIYCSRLKQVVCKCVSEHIPPWWVCAWAREHTPGLRRHSSHHIASMTHRMGQRDGASPPATPAKPPLKCPEAHNRSASKPLTTDALVERSRQISTVVTLFVSSTKQCKTFHRKGEHTFSTFPGFWRVCRPPVSKLDIKVMRKLM